MELKDLVGIHMLDAVDYGQVDVRQSYGSETVLCNMLRMRIDNVTYVCIENPDDGYRSSMRALRTLEPGETPILNVFGYIIVECKHDVGVADTTNDLLKVYDVENGKLILEVGTANTDDYYPYYVANWSPENMHINEGKEHDKCS